MNYEKLLEHIANLKNINQSKIKNIISYALASKIIKNELNVFETYPAVKIIFSIGSENEEILIICKENHTANSIISILESSKMQIAEDLKAKKIKDKEDLKNSEAKQEKTLVPTFSASEVFTIPKEDFKKTIQNKKNKNNKKNKKG